MKVKELNIKQDFPPADVAVACLEIEIEALTNTEYGAIKVIHGYGSHGKGGEIKRLLRERLKQLKSQKKIIDYVEGEKWGKEAIEKFNVVKNFPELLLGCDINCYNNGITIVFLNEKLFRWNKEKKMGVEIIAI